MPLRVRFDSSHVACVVHNSKGLYRRASAETAGIRHACASRGNVDQRGAAVEAVSEKKFSDPSFVHGRKGGRERVRGEKLVSEKRFANCTGPFWTCL